MQLLIVRHAQSANNKLWADTGEAIGRHVDPPITEHGVAQAQSLSRCWGSRGIPVPTHIYSSLMMRTIQTAAPSADALGLPINARTDSFECSGPYEGPFEDQVWRPGSGRSVLQAVTPRVVLPDACTEEGWFPGPFETEEVAHRRAFDLLAVLKSTHSAGDVVALFTHGAFGGFLMQKILGNDTFCYQFNTGHSLFRFNGDEGVELHWANRIDHLQEDQLSR